MELAKQEADGGRAGLIWRLRNGWSRVLFVDFSDMCLGLSWRGKNGASTLEMMFESSRRENIKRFIRKREVSKEIAFVAIRGYDPFRLRVPHWGQVTGLSASRLGIAGPSTIKSPNSISRFGTDRTCIWFFPQSDAHTKPRDACPDSCGPQSIVVQSHWPIGIILMLPR